MGIESARERMGFPDLVGARSMESRLAPSSIGFMIVSRPDVVKLGENDDVDVGPKKARGSKVKAEVVREGEEEVKEKGSAACDKMGLERGGLDIDDESSRLLRKLMISQRVSTKHVKI